MASCIDTIMIVVRSSPCYSPCYYRRLDPTDDAPDDVDDVDIFRPPRSANWSSFTFAFRSVHRCSSEGLQEIFAENDSFGSSLLMRR